MRPCNVRIVFDGWQGGWADRKKGEKKGVDNRLSRLGETADSHPRLIREREQEWWSSLPSRDLAVMRNKLSVLSYPRIALRER